MTWATYVLIIHLKAERWCARFVPVERQKACEEEIVDCVLDGETLKFCKANFKDYED